MEFKELVKERRSVRKYKETKLKEEEIKEILSCAQLAPSWKNSQTGRYYVALSKEAIEAVNASLPEYNRRSSVHAAFIVASFKKKDR